jgi:hypothetical protein
MVNRPTQSAAQTPREVIQDIRNRYRVGQDIDESDPYHEIARGTVPLVTDELYESNTHFFSELLQNADDNEYPPGVKPELVIEAYKDRIEVINNEIGFRTEHVRAICSLAKSTKRDRKESSTGEKGIGFKAVFQATDTPEVHSNGFHFRFDKKRDPVFGMVIPEWIEGAKQPVPGTRIVLPLNTQYRLPHDFLKSLQPELLLFLRKIRRLAFRDFDYGHEVTLARTDTGSVAVVTRTVKDDVEASRSSEHRVAFFLHKRRVAMDHIDEPRRRKIAATEVAIALPLNSQQQVDAKSSRRGLFAFLPVKQTELPFLCHGDFVLSTSREAIREDLEWNRAVRDALGACLADCIAECRATAIGATALRCLVDPSGIQDKFLRPIMSDAIDRLKETPCVPIADGYWADPSASIAADAAGLWQLLDGDDFPALLDKHLVDPTVDGISTALKLLDVDSFELGDLAACLDDEGWRSSRDPAWWASCYSTLGRLKSLGDAARSVLNATPLFPLTSGAVTARGATRVFRQLSTKGTYGFESALSILDPRVLQACTKSQKEHVESFLQQMKVHDATPVRVIDDHIVPLHRGDEWEALNDTTLAAHVLYVRDHMDQYLAAKGNAQTQALATLRQSLRIQSTASNTASSEYDHASDLYLGRAYGDAHDLEAILDGIADSCVSPRYLDCGAADNVDSSRQSWRGLLVKLGAKEIPPVSQNSGVTDYMWPDEVLGSLRDSGSERQRRLLQLISDNWSHYGKWQRRPRQGEAHSSLLTALRDAQVTTGEHQVPLRTCYRDNEENRAVFGDSVPFLQCQWSEDFCDAVGVVHLPTVDNALDRLQSLKASGCTEPAAVEPIYKFLDSRFAQHGQEITTRLEDEDLILAHHGESLAWLAVSQVRWSIPRHLREYASAGSLSMLWRDFQGFFVERIGVDKELVADDLVDVLEALAESEEDSDTLRKAVASIYRELATAVRSIGDDDQPEWLDRLRSGSHLYTTGDEWWRNDENVFVDDEPGLTPLFEADASVAFLAVSRDSLTQLRPLFDALDIQPLSEAIETEVPDDIVAESWSGFDSLWRERNRLFVRLLHHKHPAECDEAFQEGTLGALLGMDAQLCRPLELTVTLRELAVRHGFQATITSDEGHLTLFVDERSKGDWTRIGIEIGNRVGISDSESVTIGQLLSEPLDKAESLLATLKVAELPDQLRERLFGEHADDWLDALSENGDGCDDTAVSGGEPEQEQEPAASGEASQTPTQTASASSRGEKYNKGEPPARDPAGVQSHQPDKPPGEQSGFSHSDNEPPGQGRGETSTSSVVQPTHGDSDGASAETSRSWGDQSPDQPPRASGIDSEDSGPSTNEGPANGEEAEDSDVKVRSHSRSRPGGRAPAFGRHGLPDAASFEHGPPIEPKRPGSGRDSDRPASNDSRERLRSYVDPEKSEMDSDKQSERTETIKAIESAAIEVVLAEERRLGRVARDLNAESQHNRGHDVLSHLPDGTDERFIEVKGVAGAWGQRGVMVTPAQFECALQYGDKAWLYVVEHALTSPKLHRIRDFARRVWRFGFDEGWGEVAEEASRKEQMIDADVLPLPAVGMQVVLADGRRGGVEDIKGAGRLLGAIIRLESGDLVQKRWVPGEIRPATGGS